MSKIIERKAKKGRAAWKRDSVWNDEEADDALKTLRDTNPHFEFRFREYKKRERFTEEDRWAARQTF